MPTAPVARRSICTVCWGVRADDGHVDLCQCQRSRDDDDDGDAAERNIPCALCPICALTVVHGHTRWMIVNCNECSTRATVVNRANKRLVIPIGIHSLVNGVAVRPSGDDEELDRQIEGLFVFLAGMGDSLTRLWARRRRLVKARCHRLGLVGPELIDVDEYIAAARAAGYTEENSFNRYLSSIRRRGRSFRGPAPSSTAP